jgi:predicted peptidase
MRTTTHVLATLGCSLFLTFFGCATAPPGLAPEPPSGSAQIQPGTQRAQHLVREVVRRLEARYLLHLPRDYGTEPGKRWPLILYLHGGSLRGDDVEQVRKWGVPRRAEEDPAFPFIVVTPQAPAGTLWTDVELLIALLDEVGSRYAVDPERVYLTGHSMGGNGTWFLAYMHPERFAAIAPMSAPANPWWATRLASVPTLVFHGANDEVVPLRASQEMVEALQARGAPVTFHVLPGRDHGILAVYEDPSLYTWLLQHRRPNGGR